MSMWRQLAGRVWWRFFWTAVLFGIVTGTAFLYRQQVFGWLLVPADGRLSPFPGGLPVFSDPVDALRAVFGVAAKVGLIAVYPFALYNIYTLFRPVLPPRYRRVFLIFAPASYICFLGGAAFVYYVMMPVMLSFLLNGRFTEGIAVPLIDVGKYLDLLFTMAFWFGAIFQIPLVMFVLSKWNIAGFGYQRFRRLRRRVGIFAVILSIVVTPTFDGATMAMMAAPIYLLYEFGLFLSWAARPSDGNYLFIKSIGRAIRWVYRKVKAVVLAPVTVPRWLFRKVLRR